MNMQNLINSFYIMGQGMAGILIVLVVIALVVTALSKLTSKKPKDDK